MTPAELQRATPHELLNEVSRLWTALRETPESCRGPLELEIRTVADRYVWITQQQRQQEKWQRTG